MGLFFFSQGLAQKIITRDTHSGWDHLVSWMVGVWLWFLFTPLVFWAGRRFPLDRKPLWRSLVVHLPISLILPVVDLGIEAEILRSLHVFADFMATYTAAFGFLLIIGYHQGIITYWALLGARYGYGWYRRYEERRQEALRLELRWIVFIVKSLRAPLTMPSLGICLLALLFAGLISNALFYRIPATLGMRTGLPLYAVGSSTFGTQGGYLMPGSQKVRIM